MTAAVSEEFTQWLADNKFWSLMVMWHQASVGDEAIAMADKVEALLEPLFDAYQRSRTQHATQAEGA